MDEFKKPLLIWLTWEHWVPIKCRPVLIIPESLNHAYVIPGTSSKHEDDSVCINIENTQGDSTKLTHFIPKQGFKYCIKCLNRLIVTDYPQRDYGSNSYNPEEVGLDLDKIIDMKPRDLQNHCDCPLEPLQVGDTIFHKNLNLFGAVMEVNSGKIRWIILDDEKKEGEKIIPAARNKLPKELYFNRYYPSQFNRNEFVKIGRLDFSTEIKLHIIAKRSKFFG